MRVFILTAYGNITIPFMANRVPAGFPSPATDYIDKPIDLNEELIEHPSSTFMIRVEGDSMVDAFIPDKSLLIIDRSITAKNNDIVLAALDGDFTVKRYVTREGGVQLVPANKKFKPIIISKKMNFMVWGVVTNIIIKASEV